MEFWIAIIIIVAMTSATKIVRSHHQAKARIEVARGDNTETAALLREVAALNSRIAVLERIITDNRSSASLAHEIDALRDR